MTKSKSPEQRIAELEMQLSSQSTLLANVRRTMSRWANDESFASLLQGGPQWIDGVNIQQNTVEADRINAENLQALAVDTGSLTVDGDITLGTGGRIVDSNGSYWDEDEIVFKAAATILDRLRWERDTFTPEMRFGGYITATRAFLSLYGIGPTYAAALQLQSDDTDSNATAALNVGSGSNTGLTASAAGSIVLTILGSILATINANGIIVDGDVFEQANDGVSSTLKGGLQTSTVLVDNTTTETTLYSATIPANYLKNAVSAAWERVLHFTAFGYVSFDDVLIWTLRLKLGGSTVHTQPIVFSVGMTAGNTAAFTIDIWIYPRSSSQVAMMWRTIVGTDAAPTGSYDFGAPAGSAPREVAMSGEALISLTNTSAQSFSLTGQMSVTGATNYFELLNGHIVRH